MLDLLAAKGTIEVLEFIQANPGHSSSQIINDLTSNSNLASATLYRRIKELELAGLIIREPDGSKFFILSSQGIDILMKQEVNKELRQLKRPHRALLQEIEEQQQAKVVDLKELTSYSLSYVNQAVGDLSQLGLIEEVTDEKPLSAQEPSTPSSRRKPKPGRPAKLHQLTTKGKKLIKAQMKIEKAE